VGLHNRNDITALFTGNPAVFFATRAETVPGMAAHPIHVFLDSWFQCSANRPMEKIGV
jgi:hypothetical protein